MKGPVVKTEKAFGREAFGSGRQPGEVGRPVSRGWRWNSGSSGGGFNSGSGGGWSSGSSGGGFNSGSSGYHPGSTTNRPPAHGAGWGYPSSTSRPWSGSSNGGQGYNPGTGGSQGGFNPGTSGSGGSSQGKATTRELEGLRVASILEHQEVVDPPRMASTQVFGADLHFPSSISG